MKLHYGMKLLIPVNPIDYCFYGIGISSSNSKKVNIEFTVEKYWAELQYK